MHSPGPNDFHFANGVQLPGLGADEPTEHQRSATAASVAEENERRAALERTAEALQQESVALDERATNLEAREAALAAREVALGAAVDTIDSTIGGKGNVARQAKQATDRTAGS